MSHDLLITIDSDDESDIQAESNGRSLPPAKEEDLDPDFEFDFTGQKQQEVELRGGDEVKDGKSGAQVRFHTVVFSFLV